MIKELLKAIGINTYEDEYFNLLSKHETLQRSHQIIKAANDILAKDIIKLEDKLALVSADPEMYIEQEIEKRSLTLEEEIEDKIKHKYMAIGRSDAFSTYGVLILEFIEECRKYGKEPAMVLDEDRKLIDLIGLEDVKAEGTGMVADADNMTTPDLDGIIIDDLVDVGA